MEYLDKISLVYKHQLKEQRQAGNFRTKIVAEKIDNFFDYT